jgi:hypothetical protein
MALNVFLAVVVLIEAGTAAETTPRSISADAGGNIVASVSGGCGH